MFVLKSFIEPHAAALHEIHDRIDDLNAAKSSIFKAIKKDAGKLVADGLKVAFGIARMDPAKRIEKLAIDARARTILTIRLGEDLVAANDAQQATEPCQEAIGSFDAWRRTREEERSQPYPPLDEVVSL